MRGRTVRRGLKLVGILCALGLFAGLGCGPKYPECKTDDHCKDYGEYCVNNMCRECRDNSHCNAEDACMVCGPNYTCVKQAGCCHSDLDCPVGVCRKAPGAEVGQCYGNCDADNPCPEGQKCENNMCVPAAECTGPGQCGPDRTCVDGRCVPRCEPEVVYFDFDESRLRQDAQEALRRNVQCIRERGQHVTIEGHCDERGTNEYNMALGSRRANSVKRYLTELGISADMISTISYGEERPVCRESHEGCWRRNRRAEFRFR